jgi:hypothetical protein
MIKLLCTRPDLSVPRIAVMVDRTPETVSRYRRILRANGWRWEELEPLSLEALDARFNKPRHRPPAKTPVDMQRVLAILKQGRTMRDAWEDYRAHLPRPHLSLNWFRETANAQLVWSFGLAELVPVCGGEGSVGGATPPPTSPPTSPSLP